jgi:phosphate transport system protein
MGEARQRFHEQLRTLEDDIQGIGGQAGRLLAMALRGLSEGDVAVCDAVVRGDDEVDRRYLDVEQRIISLFALQTPVACDLRLLTALLHINLHLERIADQAVNLAKITCLVDGLPPNPQVLQGLGEMGTRALDMLATAMQALARRDLGLAHSLATLDDAVDKLNRGMLERVLAAAGDPKMLEWGIRMYVVARQIERIGDNAVDIGEQVAFVVSGKFQEFTDASHPELEHPELLAAGS